jgi:hypothetical protein
MVVIVFLGVMFLFTIFGEFGEQRDIKLGNMKYGNRIEIVNESVIVR